MTFLVFSRPKLILLVVALAVALTACTFPNAPATKGAAKASGDFSDGEILQVLVAINNGEIRQAKLVAQNSTDQSVRDAAQLIIDDHTRANKQIDSIAMAGMKLDKSLLSRGLEAQTEQIREELAELRGTAFDCSYLQKQIHQHELALETIRKELQPDAEGRQVKELLSTMEPVLERHLEAARSAREGMTRCPAS